MASLDSSMPPSTDCSAATSCGGCRSYSGAVACGLLYSSATATDRPPSPRARRPHASPEGSTGREAGIADPNVRSSSCYRRAPTIRARRQLAEDVRKVEGAESNTGVHASLHNLWTSRWTQASRHVETAGDGPWTSAGSPHLTCAKGTHLLWTAESRQENSRAASRVAPAAASAPVARTGTTKRGCFRCQVLPRPDRAPRDAARG